VLGRGGVPSWRAIAARVDLLRSTGARHAWRRWRRDRALGRLIARRRREIVRALWSEAASELDASVREVEPNLFEFRRAGTVTRVSGQGGVALNTLEASALANDKAAAYQVLASAALPVPEHLLFSARSVRAAFPFLAGGLCVVKPAAGRGGDGVTCGLHTARDLRRAALAASKFGTRLLIERQVEGDVFRFLVLDGELLDVVRRTAPSLEGDGMSPIEELIFAEYDRRLADDSDGLKPFAVDLDCLLALASAGLSLKSVPAAGTSVRVKSVTNYNRREENQSLGRAVSHELKALAVHAADALGLRLAGVDLVANTWPDATDGVVVDVNPMPGLHHHHYIANPAAATSVAVPILRALLEDRTPRVRPGETEDDVRASKLDRRGRSA
jgi:D-alanine-D-alanine ligase-like ATP-grasp enzyme